MEIRFDGPGRLVIEGTVIEEGGTEHLTAAQLEILDAQDIPYSLVETKDTKPHPKPKASANGTPDHKED